MHSFSVSVLDLLVVLGKIYLRIGQEREQSSSEKRRGCVSRNESGICACSRLF